jgi:predicted flap endonuclease-1-like 5' DNA nuclease
MIAQQRLYLTADKQTAVAEGDKRAAFLYAVPGDEIPDSAAKLFGLVDGGLPKSGKPAASKTGEDQTGNVGGDDLTALKGIGRATAKALADAGIATFKALAEIDPAKPPLMIPGSGEADWTKWVDAAKEKAGAGS